MNKICLKCGKSFDGHPKQQYCSRFCYYKSGNLSRPPKKPRGNCLNCGKLIEKLPWPHPKFCSRECYLKSRKGKPCPNRKRRIVLVCQICAKSFEVQAHLGGQKYCSKQCANEANRRQKKDKGYCAWRRLSKAVRDRDGKCVLCGTTNKALQAHHVIPKTWQGHPNGFKGEEKPEELISLCVHCHNCLDTLTRIGYQNNPNFNPWDLINLLKGKA